MTTAYYTLTIQRPHGKNILDLTDGATGSRLVTRAFALGRYQTACENAAGDGENISVELFENGERFRSAEFRAW